MRDSQSLELPVGALSNACNPICGRGAQHKRMNQIMCNPQKAADTRAAVATSCLANDLERILSGLAKHVNSQACH